MVRAVSAASTSVDGHVVYVATSTEEPVSRYISDGQSNDLALSLTLAPRGRATAAHPSVAALADLLRAMAQRRLPAGFQVKGSGPKAHCAPGLKITRTQLIQGATASVLTLGVRNQQFQI